MNIFTQVILWIDIAFVVLFVLVRFIVPSLLPFIESKVILFFKKIKGNKNEK